MRRPSFIMALLLGGLAYGCGSSPSGPTAASGPETPPEATPAPESPECAESFASTFEGIQRVVFERGGCTADTCHGSAVSGGLDLREGASYGHLLEAPSTGSPLPRVQPGEPTESFLYLKLKAATAPGSVTVAGSPMPVGLSPISEDLLEAVRMWIEGGAPETGSLGDQSFGGTDLFERAFGGCLPEPEPVTIKPLEPPPADEGIQFEMPPFTLAAATEVEVCFASYYDFSDRVPDRFKSADGNSFYINGSRLRQDPQSHHFVVTHSGLDASAAHDPSFGAWTCHGGARDGEDCDPLDLDGCGEGSCATAPQSSVACIGFGPSTSVDVANEGIGGAQTAQQLVPSREGAYRTIPIRGILFWNSHAFNLTTRDHLMHSRLNVSYTDDLRFPMVLATDSTHIFIQAGQPPFTVQHYCADHVAPEGAQMIRLASHTHKRGRNFTVDLPDGTRIYESLSYSDPLDLELDPPIVFDSSDPAERTLRYCADFNNGLADDGSFDTELVTRASRMPDRTSCPPVACAEGRVGEPCSGTDDHATCDTSPGAGDGLCDACAITPGVTTENEMFLVIPTYILPRAP